MASTFFGLTIAYTGLQAAQAAINVTSHNLSNINTDGYTREQAAQEARDALRTYATYGTLGSGVDVTAINQIRDSYYDEKYRNNMSNYGEYEAKNNYMTQIQDYLNEFILEGYCKEYENFFAAVNQLTITPENESAKDQLVNNSLSLTDYFNTLSTNFRKVQEDANNEIKDAVEHINSLAQNIASLNKQINQIEACYGNANDLRDQRNALLDELAEISNITIHEVDLGNDLTSLQVSINGQSLIDNYNFHTLEAVSRDTPRNVSDADGLYDIQWDNGQSFNIYSKSLGGQLRALVDIRDGCNGEIEKYTTRSDGVIVTKTEPLAGQNTEYKGIPFYQSQINTFMQVFTDAVNDILVSGYVSNADTNNPANKGIPLFTTKQNAQPLTASTVTVNKKLINDPNKLATKSTVSTGEANDDIMDRVNHLQSEKFLNGGTGAYFLESIVSDMSVDADRAESFLANYNNLKTSIQNQRLSVMGVDTDEEAMSLMKYQQAYNLSSKMMSVLNQIYDKLINGTGL